MNQAGSLRWGLSKRPLTAGDGPILLAATLVNLNWCEHRFTEDDVRRTPQFAHYTRADLSRGDFGIVAKDAQGWAGVVWVLFLPAHAPGFGWVSPAYGEVSLCAHERVRRTGLGRELLSDAIDIARERGDPGLSLSVEEGNGARELCRRMGFIDAGPTTAPGTMILTF